MKVEEDLDESKGVKVALVVSDDTMGLVDRDKKKELKPIMDSVIKDLKSGVTTIRI